MNADEVAELWLAEQLTAGPPDSGDAGDYWDNPSPDTTRDEWAVLAALMFLDRRGVTFAPIGAVLRLIWLEGWAIGDAAARAVLADSAAAWTWAEGDADAALRSLPEASGAAAETWGTQSAAWVQSIAAGRLQALARLLADGLANGWTSRQLATRIRDALRDRSWAGTTALTELVRASSAAASSAYQQAGATAVQWMAENDEATCRVCLDNEAQGEQPVGATWPDGSDAPPAHPSCRCWIAPA